MNNVDNRNYLPYLPMYPSDTTTMPYSIFSNLNIIIGSSKNAELVNYTPFYTICPIYYVFTVGIVWLCTHNEQKPFPFVHYNHRDNITLRYPPMGG